MSLTVPLSVMLQTSRGIRRITAEARDLTFREVVPGGYASARVPLHRPLSLQPDEIAYYGRMTIVDDRSGAIMFDGRMEDPARSAGSDGEVWELSAVGPAAHASDDTAPLVYVDRDLTSLTRATVATDKRGGTNIVGEDPGGSGLSALVLQFPTGLVVAPNERTSIAYNRIMYAGQKLARYAFDWDTGVTDADTSIQAVARTGPAGAINAATSPFNTAGGSVAQVVVTNFADGRDRLELRINRSTSSLTIPNDTYWGSIRNLVIRAMLKDAAGNDITTGYSLDTVYAHEVVADLLGRLLTQYDGASASIATTTHPITQLAYPDGVKPAGVLADLMLLEPAYYWAAWERNATGKHRFEWAAWPSVVRYEATALDGYDSAGSGDGLYDVARVRWRDVGGEVRTTRRTQTVPALSAAGFSRAAFIDLGDEVGSSANADRAGDQFLAEHLYPPNAGRLTIARPVLDHTAGRMVQPWEIRAGSLIRVRGILPRIDALNASARDGVTVFRVRAKEYSAARAMATLELDSYPSSVAHALAELRRRPVTRRR